MDVLCTADEAYRRHTETATIHHLLRTLDEAWVVRQTKIVVGAEVEHFLTIYLDCSLLRAFNNTFLFVETCLLQILQSGSEMFFYFSVHEIGYFKSFLLLQVQINSLFLIRENVYSSFFSVMKKNERFCIAV